MIVDSSAVLAILKYEPEADAFTAIIDREGSVSISSANYFESAIIIDAAKDPIISRRFDEFIDASGIVIEPVTEAHARVAREAYRDFGKGSRHPAQLNFGDCFAYALARVTGESLLFKGNDFVHTDLQSALA